MRGAKVFQSELYSYLTLERRVPPDHPLRAIRVLLGFALERMDAEFAGMYSKTGRPSIP